LWTPSQNGTVCWPSRKPTPHMDKAECHHCLGVLKCHSCKNICKSPFLFQANLNNTSVYCLNSKVHPVMMAVKGEKELSK
jgi:hypothetical protein